MFRHLKMKDYLAFVVLVCMGYLYAVAQKYFIPENVLMRTVSLLIVSIVLFIVFFFIVDPAQPAKLSRTLSLILGFVVGLIILVQHYVITYTPSLKNLIVLAISIVVPFISGPLYGILNNLKRKNRAA
ncbi:MAG TPA: hypothetical protein VLX91_11895 [Candidatus Acidoferrales bacterium]|nr:hypothetical protein [Candidatus Acidoferrales bacterium]